MRLEGEFALPALLRLPDEDLEFIIAFVKASGSLKEIARQEGHSYPTIRNRLDEIIAHLDGALAVEDQAASADPKTILDAVARGALSVAEALRQLSMASPRALVKP